MIKENLIYKTYVNNVDIQMESYEDVKRSNFNEAALKMTRIHKLQDTINLCSTNKLGFFVIQTENNSITTTQRNYEVIFQCINQLYQEVYPKCSEEERKETNKKRNILIEYMRDYNPYTTLIKINGDVVSIFNQGNWVVFEEELTSYESDIRNLLEVHQLSGRNMEDDEGL